MNPKEVFHNTAYSVQLPYIELVTPFKQKTFTHYSTSLYLCHSYNNTPSPPPVQDKFLPSPVTRRVFHLFLITIPLHPLHYKINSFPLLSLEESLPPLSYNNTPSPHQLQDKFLPSPVTRRESSTSFVTIKPPPPFLPHCQ